MIKHLAILVLTACLLSSSFVLHRAINDIARLEELNRELRAADAELKLADDRLKAACEKLSASDVELKRASDRLMRVCR